MINTVLKDRRGIKALQMQAQFSDWESCLIDWIVHYLWCRRPLLQPNVNRFKRINPYFDKTHFLYKVQSINVCRISILDSELTLNPVRGQHSVTMILFAQPQHYRRNVSRQLSFVERS